MGVDGLYIRRHRGLLQLEEKALKSIWQALNHR